MAESGGFFQILTHDNYEQMVFIWHFLHKLYTTANQKLKYHTL